MIFSIKTETEKKSEKVSEIIKDEKGFYTVVIGNPSTQSSVRCSIDSIYAVKINDLKTGNKVIIKGICSGYNSDELLGSDVMLVRSVPDL